MFLRHRFHIVMNEELIYAIRKCEVLDGKTFSKKIEGLLYMLKPVMKKVLMREKDEESRYLPVGNTHHKMIYMNEGIYRFLKKIHTDLNYFSIAQIIRRACRLFLRFVEKWGGEKALKKLQKFIKSLSKVKKKIIDRRNFIKSLSFGPELKPILQVAYDAFYRPIIFHQLE